MCRVLCASDYRPCYPDSKMTHRRLDAQSLKEPLLEAWRVCRLRRRSRWRGPGYTGEIEEVTYVRLRRIPCRERLQVKAFSHKGKDRRVVGRDGGMKYKVFLAEGRNHNHRQ